VARSGTKKEMTVSQINVNPPTTPTSSGDNGGSVSPVVQVPVNACVPIAAALLTAAVTGMAGAAAA